MTSKIQLLLATYNEAACLDAFLDSIVRQTSVDWSLLVRDDGSSDATQRHLVEWNRRLGSRMKILPDSGAVNLGVAGNFSRLLAASSAPYVMFANPDDVWYPSKIETTWRAMRSCEAECAAGTSCLVHTDLEVVDAQMRRIAPSLWAYQGLKPNRNQRLSRFMVENTVWACTAMINRPLVDLAGAIPEESHNEDWWVALVAAAFGRIVSLPEQTIAWRRHGGNDSVFTRLTEVVWSSAVAPLEKRRHLHSILNASVPRVRVFLQRYRALMSEDQVAAAEAFIGLLGVNAWDRRAAVLRHQLLFTSSLRNLGMLLFL
jgi:glycosyltransferase involved in cell wall biosynthesis